MSKAEPVFKISSYELFYERAKLFLGDRIFKDYLRCFAYSIDASCYRYIPKIVIIASHEDEIVQILKLSDELDLALSFRAAGTSLSGQACCDSILVLCNTHWKTIKLVFDETKQPSSIWCDCGVIGASANEALKPYAKKIGPDPATINNALIGGIFSNNSSGMCCGVKQNTYQTIKSVRVILQNGFVLDTSQEQSVFEFMNTYADMVEKLLALRTELLADSELSSFIRHKFKIKNTTGYSLNALLDFEELKDILNHIFIGAEGTLAFVSRVELECVKDFKHKACALIFYEDILSAAKAIKILAQNDDLVSAAEIMDYASLLSVQNLESLPAEIKQIKPKNCAILIQLEEDDKEKLEHNIAFISQSLASIQSLFGVRFSFDAKEQESWWKVRKGLLPLTVATRASASTVITEDICFEIDHFAAGIEGIEALLQKHNFKGIIFGHALSGNVHFIITPLLGIKEESERFGIFMQDLVDLVVSYNGSIKAEHGTGRMMAPFVKQEWGEKAYKFNLAIKEIFDPKKLINPDVIISEDQNIHLKNFKPASANLIEDYLDACMECGFCEKICPSKDLSLTPRQRIAVYREIARLKSKTRTPSEQKELNELEKGFEYLVVKTCATCSMCATLCPIEIDTAKIASKASQVKGFLSSKIASNLAKNMAFTTKLAGFGVSGANLAQNVFGAEFVQGMSEKLNRLCHTPLLSAFFPSKNTYKLHSKLTQTNEKQVVYFSSCLNRIFNPSKKAPDQRSIAQVFENLCKKADFSVIYPSNLSNLCCSKAFKNHEKEAKNLAFKTFQSLCEASLNAKLPIVCDHSACSLELLKYAKEYENKAGLKLNIIDMPAFVLEYLSSNLSFSRQNQEKIALYAPCSTQNLLVKKQNLAWESAIFELAKLCGAEICEDKKVKCCGFAGNKGFLTPELNQSALRNFGKDDEGNDVFKGIIKGFSSSSTCEIGLSTKSHFAWQHIIYLVDACTD
ncbi:FAD-binding oxidoreductase [Campylobacter sp. MIT 97-5078]|uniref:FAD-binding and (Fe-S)-binding domain-containing protein n=2 Tax=Campylobacter sp. MIT 97-5078 TaxID=1548153 RepID=UPI001160537C|nr:FAD-binding and (Fe-S)-binding domain-containing protein [Campylobacter sp. MIT 97-5078]TQR27935.1 FAD-binding oxidoreductase [Campylobacter sp. MIT 97-5078]